MRDNLTYFCFKYLEFDWYKDLLFAWIDVCMQLEQLDFLICCDGEI